MRQPIDYVCSNHPKFVCLLLYVDDMLHISKSKSKICELKKILNIEFDMKDLGNAKKILGMNIERNRKFFF